MKREFIFFCIVGCIGFIIDVGVLSLLKELLGVYGARIPSFLCAASATWLLNRSYTFKGTANGSARKDYLNYLGLMMVGGGLNYAVYAVAISFLYDLQGGILLSVASGSCAGLIVNFLVSKHYIFKSRS